MTGTHRMHGRGEDCNKIVVEKPERNRPVGTPRVSLEDNIKTELKETWHEIVKFVPLAVVYFRKLVVFYSVTTTGNVCILEFGDTGG
jgi:hypothetical protein